MKASMGGIINVTLLLLFIVIIGSFLLFNVNYSKAYRVKNKVITTLEQYEGHCEEGSDCFKVIEEYENRVGYGKKNITCKGEEEAVESLGYCYKKQCRKLEQSNPEYVTKGRSCVYEVRTEIDMDFPLIEEMLGVVSGNDTPTFKIHGKTKAIIVIDESE